MRLTDDGGLIIPPLTAEDVPGGADALRAELAAMLPRVPIASVLVEVDARTGFTDHLVGKQLSPRIRDLGKGPALHPDCVRRRTVTGSAPGSP